MGASRIQQEIRNHPLSFLKGRIKDCEEMKYQNLGFLGFFKKNLKIKIAYLGGFSAKNEKKLWALLYFFDGTPWGAF